MKKFVTPKTFPLDEETGKFQSEPAEMAFITSQELGLNLNRAEIRYIIQAYQCTMDECDKRYEEWKNNKK